MALTLNSRPQKTINGIVSRFNSVHLPMVYELESDLFPSNTSDTTFNVTSVATDNKGIKLTTSGYHGLVALEWVTLSGFSEDYNGNFQILEVPALNELVVGLAFTSDDTGTAVKYYNNYHLRVEVYAGLPAYHADQGSKSLRLIDTVEQVPDSSNIVKINVADLIKQDIGFNLSTSNLDPEILSLTACYIKYAESYDSVSGGNVVTTVTSYTTDTVSGCTASGELVTNGTFTGSAAGWTLNEEELPQYGTGRNSWAYSVNNVEVTLNGTTENISDELTQAISFSSLLTYSATVVTTGVLSISSQVAVFLWDGTNYQLLTIITSSGTSNFSFTPDRDSYNELKIVYGNNSGASRTITVESVSLQASDCTAYVWGTNMKNDFRNVNGGNVGAFLLTSSDERPTVNKTPIIYPDKFFEIAYLVPNATAQAASQAGDPILRITQKDQNGTIIDTQDILWSNGNDGFYRFRNSQITLNSAAKELCSQLAYIPDNIFVNGVNGTFEGVFSTLFAWGLQSNLANYVQTTAVAQSGSGSMTITIDASNNLKFLAGTSLIKLNADSVYKVGGWVYFPSIAELTLNTPLTTKIRVFFDKRSGTGSGLTFNPTQEIYISWENTGDSESNPSSVTDTLDNFVITYGLTGQRLSTDTWYFIETEVTNPTASSVLDFSPSLRFETNGGNNDLTQRFSFDVGEGAITVCTDTWTVRGPFQALSSESCFEIDNDCTRQDFHLVWLNNQNGWDSHNFSAVKEYTVDIEDSQEIYRNPKNNWDSDFINGPFAHDFTIVKARRSYLVRSKPLTKSQVDKIESVIYSIKCYREESPGVLRGVNVQKNSFSKYVDDDNYTVLSFTVQETDYIAIQEQ